jgi:hypothetical protein
MLLLVGLTLAAPRPQSSVAHNTSTALREYLAPAVKLTDAELTTIGRGRPVGRVLPSPNPEDIFVLGVIHVNASAAAYAARVLDPQRLLALPGYRGTGLVGDPPEPAHFRGFTLESEDVEELKDCRPGDCAIQLPAHLMADFRSAARNADVSIATELTNGLTVRMAVDLVRRYREQGIAALPTYHDESEPADVGAQFRSLMERFSATALAPAETTRLILDQPRAGPATAGVHSIIYWEKVVFGLKPTLRVTHLIAHEPTSGALGCIVAIKQLYASHYLRAAFDFSACLTASDGSGKPGFYLITFKGSRQEGITGWFRGSLVRPTVVRRVRTALDGSLIRIKRALEGG